ncbi:MAG: hypothetical protein LBV06_06340 [Propionibacteriaceae bacterium]|jgi:fatty acid desaturase|nr:hypothetical protein [Propionibacteriaceae bacterium]
MSDETLGSDREPTSAAGAEQKPQTTAGQKIKTGAYVAKCGLLGGLFVIVGIVALVTGGSAWWAGILAIVYGIWLLSGIASGGWRLFIY